MTNDTGNAGERRRRSPVLPLLATLALVALTSTAVASAGGNAAQLTVSPNQRLATLHSPHEAHSQPASGSGSLGLVPAKTPLTEQPTVLPVLAQHGEWLLVRLPGRPNGHTGWIRLQGTSRTDTTWHLVVAESRRQVSVYRSGRIVRIFLAIVGKPSTPTPRGEFFVEESIALRPADIGAPFALALSARSEVYQEFDGGPGQVALHGLANIGGTLGTAASHGCIRLADNAMRWLVLRIGPGTPVTITS